VQYYANEGSTVVVQKKEHIAIGIFQGRSAPHNIAILQALWEQGDLTSWQLAKHVCRVHHSSIELTAAERKLKEHDIYSLLIRKGGRLEELKQKGYIKAQNNQWTIGLKAYAVLLLKPELASLGHVDSNLKIDSQNVLKELRLPQAHIPGITVQVDKKVFAGWLEKSVPKLDDDITIAKLIGEIVEEGLDLDRVSNERLKVLLAVRMVPLLQDLLPQST